MESKKLSILTVSNTPRDFGAPPMGNCRFVSQPGKSPRTAAAPPVKVDNDKQDTVDNRIERMDERVVVYLVAHPTEEASPSSMIGHAVKWIPRRNFSMRLRRRRPRRRHPRHPAPQVAHCQACSNIENVKVSSPNLRGYTDLVSFHPHIQKTFINHENRTTLNSRNAPSNA